MTDKEKIEQFYKDWDIKEDEYNFLIEWIEIIDNIEVWKQILK